MKALSIVRPGGSRIATGEKTIEVRRWAPRLAPEDDLLIVENGIWLHSNGDEEPNGTAVAIVRVAHVRPFTTDDVAAACASSFADGWLAWELTAIRPITTKPQILAARGIYEVTFP